MRCDGRGEDGTIEKVLTTNPNLGLANTKYTKDMSKIETKAVIPAETHGQDAHATTYPERAVEMTKQARRAACESAGKHWEVAAKATSDIEQAKIIRINELREAGIDLNTACGREQLLFTADGFIFTREKILPHLPPDMTVEAVRACVHIANKMPAPITTVAEVNLLEKQLQVEFALLGLAESHKRKELQSPHVRDLFSNFVSRAARLEVLIDELEKDPDIGAMDKWNPELLDEFIETMKPAKEKIERAEKLRLRRV